MEVAMEGSPVLVSVIIPVKNEGSTLGACLTALKVQTLGRHRVEVIVVDNGSTDDSVRIATESADKVLTRPNIRLGAVRNAGAREATGEVFAFLDGDCIPEPDWLESGLAALKEGGAVVANEYSLPENPTWIETTWKIPSVKDRTVSQAFLGGNFFISRTLFFELSGFNETLLSAEDTVFSFAVRTRGEIIYDPRLKVVHLGNPKTLRALFRQQLWHGLDEVELLKWTRFPSSLLIAVGWLGAWSLLLLGILLRVTPIGSIAIGLAVFGMALVVIGLPIRRLMKKGTADIILACRLGTIYCVVYSARSVALIHRLLGLGKSGRK
jgi:glycosyltransferase involved in cell wall biosynthesis